MSIRVRRMFILSVGLLWCAPCRGTLPPVAVADDNVVRWAHPAGLVTEETIAEIRSKIATQDWARRMYTSRKDGLDRWLTVPTQELRRVFPRRRGNVYHNFSCPQDRCRLRFDPLEPDAFECPLCATTFAPETDAGVYRPDDRYAGTMYDGWVCLFHLDTSQSAADLSLISRIELAADGAKYAARGVEILMLYADTLETLATKTDADPQMTVLLTYHREGDSAVLYQLARAYELLRDRMTPEQRDGFERSVLLRMLDDLMLEPIYRYNHNNLYQWHRTIIQAALALERDDLIDWCFGYGDWDPEHQPDHRSLRRLVATHFKPDGAFWEMCSGYHLYPLNALCELAVISRNLSRGDPDRFPAERYDLTAAENPGSDVIRNALHWFMSMAMPDRTMPTVGDSMAPRAGMNDYIATAEVGYRHFDLHAVGDYEAFRQGQRSWEALLYGVPRIASTPLPCTSSHLSSGWVSLRNEWQGNPVWIGLNALIPGGGHQHADRLSLLSYSHGKLLALEKATPYNEHVTRELGTLSQSHNTVTIDRTSQKQGEALSGEEIPVVAYFFAPPVAQFAELHADRLYPQTALYRRSVLLIEDIHVDMFRVEGGTTHDWMMHHAGGPPRFSMPMRAGTFSPLEWLANGTRQVRYARVDDAWDVRWAVDQVTSRLTIMGAAGTDVFALETYPVDNAVITPENPPCQTLCVRRTSGEPYLVVGDAWIDEPNLRNVARGEGSASLRVQTANNVYYLLLEAGGARFDDGVSITSDARLSLLRNRDAVMVVDGAKLRVASPEGALDVTADRRCSLSAERREEEFAYEVSGNIQYDTYGGADHYREAPAVEVSWAGDLWPAFVSGFGQ